jgi:hypothetical protein
MSVFPPVADVGNIPTYSSNNGATTFTVAASTTDFITLFGSASKIVEVLKVFAEFDFTATNLLINAWLIKRTAVNTGGTSAAQTITQLDSADPVATATPRQYTANPSGLGAGTVIHFTRIEMNQLGYYAYGNANPMRAVFDSDKFGKPIVLRGVSEGLALNLNGITPTGTVCKAGFLWRER